VARNQPSPAWTAGTGTRSIAWCSLAATVALCSNAVAQTPPPLTAPPPAAALQAGTGAATERLLPLEVTVNGAKGGTWLLIERLGALYAPRDAFDEWRLRADPDAAAFDYRGTDYLPLAGIPGYGAKVNFGNQSVDLTFSPQAFAATRLTAEVHKRPVLSPAMPSAFLNYDLSHTTLAPRHGPTTRDMGMLGELGLSNDWGVLTTSVAGRNLTNQSLSAARPGWMRLETTFTRDLPARNQTLRLGDASTRAGMWGRSVYFGGAQWGTNFALTPGFISQPLPVLSGVSSAPSTVELYVNDVLRQVSSVPSGPFAIDNLPALTGGGDARLVVRDLLGRETVITQPFFTASELLARGLNDWSVEAGALRYDLGLERDVYRSRFASGIWRRGVTNGLTLEGRAEVSRRSRDAGLGAVVGLPWHVLGKAAVALSRDGSGASGRLWVLGFERQTLRSGAFLQVQGASSSFRQLGEDVRATATKLQIAGNLSYSTELLGTFGLGFASVRRFDSERVVTLSANHSMRIGQSSSLTVTASRALDGARGSFVGVTLVVPLDGGRVMSGSAVTRDGRQDLHVTATQSSPLDSGWAWRTLAGRQQGQARAEGGAYYSGRYGFASGDLSVGENQSALRIGAVGGLIVADGHFFATRRLDSSFAVAEVKGYGNVGIGLGSNVLSRTDAGGIALVPRMAPYQNNSIRLDPTELPISAEIDSIEQAVVPGWRSGVKVVFPVRSGHGALLKIVFDDGEVAPAGAVVRIEGDKAEFYVARGGQAFVTGLQTTGVNRLRMAWNNRECRLDVFLRAQSQDEIERIGPLLCTGVAR